MSNQFELALAGAIPALLAMLFFDWLDRKRPEPRRTLRRVAIAGALSVIPVLIVAVPVSFASPPESTLAGAFYQAFLVAAGPEEAAKVACVWFFVYRRPEFDERMDGITYGARAGLGFALVENIAYLATATTPAGYIQMFVARAVLAVPGHAMWGAFAGYFLAIKRFDNRGPGLVGGYLLAFALHGLYDVGLFAIPPLQAQFGDVAALLLLVPVAVIGGGGIALMLLVKRAIKLDDEAEAAGRLVRYVPPDQQPAQVRYGHAPQQQAYPGQQHPYPHPQQPYPPQQPDPGQQPYPQQQQQQQPYPQPPYSQQPYPGQHPYPQQQQQQQQPPPVQTGRTLNQE